MADNTLRIKIELLLGDLNARLQRLRGDLNNLGTGENNAKKALDSTEKSAGVLGSTVGRVSSEIKSMLAGAFAVGALVAFTSKLVETVRVIQDLRLRLSGLTKSNDDFAASEAYLTDLAHRHHKSVQDLTTSYSAFLALEQSGIITRQQSIQLLEGFSNAQSKFGASNAQVAQSTYGLAQALGTGIVAMEEYKQITEPMSGLSNEIAKSFGMSVGELRKLIGTGTLASDVFGKHMVEALDAYKGAAERAGGTISASYNDVGNAYTEMAKELEKPVAGLAIGVTDAGKAAYGWLKDNGNTLVTTLTLLAVTVSGKLAGSFVAAAAGAKELYQAQVATAASSAEISAATIALAEADVIATTENLNLAESALARSRAELMTEVSSLELANTTLVQARANLEAAQSAALLSGATYDVRIATQQLAVAEQERAVILGKMQVLATEQVVTSTRITAAQVAQTASTEALSAATSTSSVAMTRLATAGRAAFSFIGGYVGVAVLALWGLYEVLNRVTDAEGNAERKANNLSTALSLMNAEIKKLTLAEIDLDFSKTEKKIETLKQQIKDLEASTHFGNINENIDKRAVLQQRIEVEEKRLDANKVQKNDLITNFDASGLTSEQLTTKLKETENEIGKIRYHIEELKRSTGDANVIEGMINEGKLALNAYNSQLSSIQGAQNALSNTGKIDPKIAEANAKSEEKQIASDFKLKAEYAKNAYERDLALAEKDSVKKIEIEKAYNAQSLALTLERLNAEIAAKTKTSELSGKKTKGPELQAELADLENQKLAAIDNAKTNGVTLDVDQQKQADNLRDKTQAAQWELEAARIELDLANEQTKQKTELDNLKRDKDKGALGGSQQDMMMGVFSAFKNAGFSPNQAKALTAEVGRENDYNPKTVFGNHTDAANGKTNTGFFSWQGDRSTALKASLTEQGLMQNGKISQSQESLNAMALFARTEMQSGQYKGSSQFLANKDIGREDAANQLGHGYVKWAMGQTKLSNGDSFDSKKHEDKRDGYYNKIGAMTGAGGDEKQLLKQNEDKIQHYYEATTAIESKGIDDRVAAIKAKLALAEKEYTTKKATATPEELPKIEADHATNKAKLTQELHQLQADLLAIKKDGDAEMAKEIAKAKQEEIDLEESSALDLVKVAETEAQQQLELGQLSNSKFLEKQREFEAERYQIALKAANDRRALLDNNDTSGLAKAEAEKNKIESDSAKTRAKINSAAIKEARKEFDDWVNPIKSALNSTITGILQGTLTLKQGMKNAFQSIALSYAQLLANKAINTAADWAFELIGFTAKEVTKGAIKTTSETVQTGATVAGVAARTATETAGAAASKTTGLAMSGASIMDAAAKAAAGTYASVAQIPYVGWILAPPAAALAFVAVAGYKSMLSSKGGEWNVADDGVRMIHEQETILPATIAAPMRDFFTKQGNPSYSLPDSATQPQTNQSATMATAASAIALQQSVIQAQQKQQRQSGGGTVVFNGKGGDFIHKNDLAKFAQSEKRNFRSS